MLLLILLLSAIERYTVFQLKQQLTVGVNSKYIFREYNSAKNLCLAAKLGKYVSSLKFHFMLVPTLKKLKLVRKVAICFLNVQSDQ